MKLQSLRVSEKKMGALQTSIDTLADEITKTQRMLIAKDDLPAAIDYIRRRGRTFGLTFHQVIPDYQELIPDSDEKSAASGVLRLTVHMKIQGRYKNFGNFIRSLATLPFYVSVSDVTLVYNQDIHPELEIMLDTVVFLLNSSKIKFRA